MTETNRLTQRDAQGNWSLKGVSWPKLYEGNVITGELHDKLYMALWKLKDYEDTGLSPEEVERMQEERERMIDSEEERVYGEDL